MEYSWNRDLFDGWANKNDALSDVKGSVFRLLNQRPSGQSAQSSSKSSIPFESERSPHSQSTLSIVPMFQVFLDFSIDSALFAHPNVADFVGIRSDVSLPDTIVVVDCNVPEKAKRLRAKFSRHCILGISSQPRNAVLSPFVAVTSNVASPVRLFFLFSLLEMRARCSCRTNLCQKKNPLRGTE